MLRVLLAPFAKLVHDQTIGDKLLVFSGMIVGPVTNHALQHDQIILRHAAPFIDYSPGTSDVPGAHEQN